MKPLDCKKSNFCRDPSVPASGKIKRYGGSSKTFKNDHFQTSTWSFIFTICLQQKCPNSLQHITVEKKKKKTFFFLQWLWIFLYLRKLLLWWCYVSILIIWIYPVFPEKLILLVNLKIRGNYIMGQKKCKVISSITFFSGERGGEITQCNPMKIIKLISKFAYIKL